MASLGEVDDGLTGAAAHSTVDTTTQTTVTGHHHRKDLLLLALGGAEGLCLGHRGGLGQGVLWGVGCRGVDTTETPHMEGRRSMGDVVLVVVLVHSKGVGRVLAHASKRPPVHMCAWMRCKGVGAQ